MLVAPIKEDDMEIGRQRMKRPSPWKCHSAKRSIKPRAAPSEGLSKGSTAHKVMTSLVCHGRRGVGEGMQRMD